MTKTEGTVTKIIDEGRRIYQVLVDGARASAQGTDLTKYEVGERVTLAKTNRGLVIVPLDLSE